MPVSGGSGGADREFGRVPKGVLGPAELFGQARRRYRRRQRLQLAGIATATAFVVAVGAVSVTTGGDSARHVHLAAAGQRPSCPNAGSVSQGVNRCSDSSSTTTTPTFGRTSTTGRSVPVTTSRTSPPTNGITIPVTETTSFSSSPPAAIIAAPAVAGMTVTFDASQSSAPSGGIIRYHWNFGDGAISDAASTAHTYASPGTYRVTLTVTDNHAGSRTTSVLVTVTSPPPRAIVAQPVVSGLTVSLDGSHSSGQHLTFDWDAGDGSTPTTGPTTTFTYAHSGSYIVTLTITDASGQIDATTVQITVV